MELRMAVVVVWRGGRANDDDTVDGVQAETCWL
jgi:hypothetical protein